VDAGITPQTHILGAGLCVAAKDLHARGEKATRLFHGLLGMSGSLVQRDEALQDVQRDVAGVHGNLQGRNE